MRLGSIAGINKHVTPLMIRRTSATLRQDIDSKFYAGDSKIVQMMFWHTNINMTMRYNNKTQKHLENYFNRIYASDLLTENSVNTEDKSYKPSQKLNKTVGEETESNNDVTVSFSVSFSVKKCGNGQMFSYLSNMFGPLFLEDSFPLFNNGGF